MAKKDRPTEAELEEAKRVHSGSATDEELWDAHDTMITGARYGTQENPKEPRK